MIEFWWTTSKLYPFVNSIKALRIRKIFQNVEHDLVKAVETKILKMSQLSDICTAGYNILLLNSC